MNGEVAQEVNVLEEFVSSTGSTTLPALQRLQFRTKNRINISPIHAA